MLGKRKCIIAGRREKYVAWLEKTEGLHIECTTAKLNDYKSFHFIFGEIWKGENFVIWGLYATTKIIVKLEKLQ